MPANPYSPAALLRSCCQPVGNEVLLRAGLDQCLHTGRAVVVHSSASTVLVPTGEHRLGDLQGAVVAGRANCVPALWIVAACSLVPCRELLRGQCNILDAAAPALIKAAVLEDVRDGCKALVTFAGSFAQHSQGSDMQVVVRDLDRRRHDRRRHEQPGLVGWVSYTALRAGRARRPEQVRERGLPLLLVVLVVRLELLLHEGGVRALESTRRDPTPVFVRQSVEELLSLLGQVLLIYVWIDLRIALCDLGLLLERPVVDRVCDLELLVARLRVAVARTDKFRLGRTLHVRSLAFRNPVVLLHLEVLSDKLLYIPQRIGDPGQSCACIPVHVNGLVEC